MCFNVRRVEAHYSTQTHKYKCARMCDARVLCARASVWCVCAVHASECGWVCMCVPIYKCFIERFFSASWAKNIAMCCSVLRCLCVLQIYNRFSDRFFSASFDFFFSATTPSSLPTALTRAVPAELPSPVSFVGEEEVGGGSAWMEVRRRARWWRYSKVRNEFFNIVLCACNLIIVQFSIVCMS